jgi:DNA-binding SARP family transcriptional activator
LKFGVAVSCAMRSYRVTHSRGYVHNQGVLAALPAHALIRISNNKRWVDVWSFERSVNGGLRQLNEPSGGDAAELHLHAALSLYCGHFLSRESEESWMLTPRLRLKTKFERLVTALSKHLEGRQRFNDAVDLCLQVLERDPLNELIYRRLMSCYPKAGELASVLRTYMRCREALANEFSSPPSIETESIYLESVRAATELSGAQAERQSHLLGVDPLTAMNRLLC